MASKITIGMNIGLRAIELLSISAIVRKFLMGMKMNGMRKNRKWILGKQMTPICQIG